MAEQALNLKLVEEVEKRPCLYNYTLNEYSRKDITEKAWNDVGEKINLAGSECKERWKNLRAVFVRHMKPGRSGTSRKSKKPYYLAEAMQFALPFIKTLSTNISGNLPAQSQVITEDLDSDHEDNNSIISPDDSQMPLSPPSCSLPTPSPQSYHAASPSTQSSPNQSSSQAKQMKKKSKRPLHDDLLHESFAEYVKTKKNQLEVDKNPQHEANKMFLLSLLPDMNQMSQSQIRSFKRKVMETIDDIVGNTPVLRLPDASSATPVTSVL